MEEKMLENVVDDMCRNIESIGSTMVKMRQEMDAFFEEIDMAIARMKENERQRKELLCMLNK